MVTELHLTSGKSMTGEIHPHAWMVNILFSQARMKWNFVAVVTSANTLAGLPSFTFRLFLIPE